MRVISGSAKGVQLQAVPGCGTRPITDRVKEALFSILGDRVSGARVLDLFAGTGGVGIEALSRGADHATFVEWGSRPLATIRANLARTELAPLARVVKADVFHFLERPPETYDLVYVAPPQYEGLWKRTLLALDAAPNWLAQDGLVVVQVFPKEFEPVPLAMLSLSDRRQYGSTLLCFFEREQ